jgi:hypothetical protein
VISSLVVLVTISPKTNWSVEKTMIYYSQDNGTGASGLPAPLSGSRRCWKEKEARRQQKVLIVMAAEEKRGVCEEHISSVQEAKKQKTKGHPGEGQARLSRFPL